MQTMLQKDGDRMNDDEKRENTAYCKGYCKGRTDQLKELLSTITTILETFLEREEDTTQYIDKKGETFDR